jgi:hypothetical protein
MSRNGRELFLCIVGRAAPAVPCDQAACLMRYTVTSVGVTLRQVLVDVSVDPDTGEAFGTAVAIAEKMVAAGSPDRAAALVFDVEMVARSIADPDRQVWAPSDGWDRPPIQLSRVPTSTSFLATLRDGPARAPTPYSWSAVTAAS